MQKSQVQSERNRTIVRKPLVDTKYASSALSEGAQSTVACALPARLVATLELNAATALAHPNDFQSRRLEAALPAARTTRCRVDGWLTFHHSSIDLDPTEPTA